MGQDWYKLGGDGGGGGGRRGGCRTSSASNTKRKTDAAESNAASGCIAALFNLLDFHLFCLPAYHHQPSPSSSKPTIDFLPKDQKGIAAPRNSLELAEESSLSTIHKEQESLSIHRGIQVETKARATRSKLGALALDTSRSTSEIVSSPGTKTPNVVARLMGLDLLPDDNIDHNHSSPHLHKLSHHRSRRIITSHRPSLNGKITGTMSLPESPRVSSARRSDFDLHRLSLHLNGENKCEEFGGSRLRRLGQEDESRSPRDYARQKVNQIKERISNRRFGMDITNTVMYREPESARNNHELRRDNVFSCLPRNRFPEKENKANTNPKKPSPSTSKTDKIQQLKPPLSPPTMKPTVVSEPKAPRVQEKPKREKQQQLRPINTCKKADSETRFSVMHGQESKNGSKQQEIFVRVSKNTKANNDDYTAKKCKKTPFPMPNDAIRIYVPSVVPIKNTPSPPATKLPQTQVKEAGGPKWSSKQSICSSQTYKHEGNLPQIARYSSVDDSTNVAATSTTAKTTGFSSEYEYITRILSYSGVTGSDSPVSSTTRFSTSYPLDLSIFHNLEHSGENPSGKLALRCNRKLLFDLVNEILANIVKPQMKISYDYHGSELIGKLWSVIGSYSRANFHVLEDIDSLVAGNPPETTKFEEEGEETAAEIERHIIDVVVRETASYLYL